MKYKIVMEQEQAGGYSVYVPELPGCASQGESVPEAVRNIKKAIKLYLWSLERDQQSLQRKHIIIKDIAA